MTNVSPTSDDSSPTPIIQQITLPFQQFIQMESASGILLVACALVAFLWANSPWASVYFDLINMPVSVKVGEQQLDHKLLFWINDGLMAVFFFLVGLEIKRELLEGELASFRKAALPFSAALGGMLVPVGIFYLLHRGQPGMEGWGIPMATDIAFAIGVLLLLGSRVPLGMKVFLTAFAIVDDIGAVLVIAVFYGHGFHWVPFAWAMALLGLLLAFNYLFSIKRLWPYLVVGIAIWLFFLNSGIHPTIAGVLIALTIPASNRIRLQKFSRDVRRIRGRLLERNRTEKRFLEEEQLEDLYRFKKKLKHVQPPLQRAEFRLNSFISFFILPAFALANAGVSLQGGMDSLLAPLTIHVAVGLVAGKTLGVFSFAWLSVRLGLADLPANTRWKHMLGLSMLGGIGFTMAIFISNLALESDALLTQAKLGILTASVVAGALGFAYLRFTLSAQTGEAEQSAD